MALASKPGKPRASLLALLEAWSPEGGQPAALLDAHLHDLHKRELARVTGMWVYESEHWREEPESWVVGTDEVGRGPLAGPLVAAAVAFRGPCHIPGLNDSKKLSARERELIAVQVQAKASAWAIGCISVDAISAGNLHFLSLGAMRQAIAGLNVEPRIVFVDGRHKVPEAPWAQRAVIKGDSLCASIAAASIIAKVARDAMMDQLHLQHPEYGWCSNRGYGTADHMEALERLGPTQAHRRNFKPVREALERAGAVCPLEKP